MVKASDLWSTGREFDSRPCLPFVVLLFVKRRYSSNIAAFYMFPVILHNTYFQTQLKATHNKWINCNKTRIDVYSLWLPRNEKANSNHRPVINHDFSHLLYSTPGFANCCTRGSRYHLFLTDEPEIGDKFLKSICGSSFYHVNVHKFELWPGRSSSTIIDSEILSRLRRHTVYPITRAKTNKYRSFIHYALAKYQ